MAHGHGGVAPAAFCMRSAATGLPTMLERPSTIMLASGPYPLRRSISMQPAVHETKPGSPMILAD